ncbi:MAG: FliG C-terminal domain-containing protein, partial [Alphaproteobacteria bacterium]
LTVLESIDRDSAERIRALMFTFDDLVKLDPSGIQTILRNIDKHKLAVALKGASEPVRNLFFTNMSERAGKILREDMQAMGPVRLRDVDESQQHIIQTTKELANKGEVVIATTKDDDELVY